MPTYNEIIVALKLKGGANMSKNLNKVYKDIHSSQEKLNGMLQSGRDKFAQQSEKIKRNNELLVNNSKQLKQVGNQFDSLSGSLRMPTEIWKKFNKAGGKFNTIGGKTGNLVRKIATGLKGFQMELLSVMFGAQMVAGAMFGLLNPALKAAGIFEIWGTILTVLFLPIALWLLKNFFLPLMEYFLSLPEGVQMIIGAFVLFAGILATIIGVGAAILLFVGGLITAFAIGGPLAMGLAAVIAFFAAWGWIIVVVIAIIVALVIAIKENFLGLGDLFKGIWDSIVSIFTGVWEIIKGVWDIFAGVFSGDWKRVWEGVKGIATGVWRILKDGFGKLIVTILNFFYELPGKIRAIMEEFQIFILAGLIWVWTNKEEWIPKVISALKAAGTKMMEWAKNIGKQIWDKVFGFGGEEVEEPSLWERAKEKASNIGSKQSGGYVPHTGLYKLHEGETVNQAGSTMNNNITINASSNVDIEMLKAQLSTQWNDEFGRLSRG